MVTISTTFKIEKENLERFEHWFRNTLEDNVIDFKILPSTEKLYKENKTFKNLIKKKKELDRTIGRFINENNI